MDQSSKPAPRRGRPGIRNLSLKQRLIVSFTSVLFIMCVGVSLILFGYTRSVLKENTISGARVNLGYLMDNVDSRLKQGEELSNWILVNRNFERVLIRNYSGADPNANRSLDIQTTYNLVYDHMLRSSISGYILSIVIYGYNDVIVRVYEEADGITLSSLVTCSWFYDGMNAGNRMVWPGIKKNISYQIGAKPEILPIVRPIIFADTLKQIGFHAIAFHPDLLRDVCMRYGSAVTDPVLLVDRDGESIYESQEDTGFDATAAALYVGGSETASGHFVTETAGLKKLVCFQTSAYSGMTAYQVMDFNEYKDRQVTAITISAVILTAITVSVLLTVFLSVRLTRPLERIHQRMARIARGDFARDPALEGTDEIGRLGRGINDLATSVDSLLERNLREEREKKALEFKLLQNQVNPHFIYNALNSIRMMAMIQKSQGIYDTANALGALLKETSKGALEKIPLREEFYLLEQFIHIHNIRKKGLIHATMDLEPGIADRLIVRFLLQPIVENAILHGFEGKKGICRLWISAIGEGGAIRVTVRDDGLGMPPERLASLFEEKPETEGGRFNRVGIWNVQEQIRHVYGDAYGMTVESVVGVGTTVTIRIPEEGEHDSNGDR